jgi:hypothetical protein
MRTRTNAEIVARIKEVEYLDIFGTEVGDLLNYLPFDFARPWLSLRSLDQWEKVRQPHTRENILKEMHEYMSFAVDKATNHRGLSASRSIFHYKAWIWLLGDQDYETIDWERYPMYGCPILALIAETYGIEIERSKAFGNMASGMSCRPSCTEGCGR